MRHPYLPSPSQTIPEPSAGTFPRPAGAAPSPGPAGPPLSAVLNGARAEGLGRGGGRDSYPSPVPQGWGKSPSVKSGWGTACPTHTPPPPSAISSLLGGSSPVLPGTGEEKIEPGRGGKYIYIKNGWGLLGIAISAAAASSPNPRGRQVSISPAAPSSGPSRPHPPFPRPRLRLAGA